MALFSLLRAEVSFGGPKRFKGCWGGMLGAFGGMVFSKYIGQVLDQIGSYTPIFIVAGSAYLIALLVIHLLTPKMEPVRI